MCTNSNCINKPPRYRCDECIHFNIVGDEMIARREQFDSGMVRDTADGKIDIDRVFDGPMVDRWADHVTKAESHYPDVAPGVPNWTLADGEKELIRFRKSAARHFRQWRRGDTDEDHAAAVFFNINGYEYVKARMKAKGPQ